MGGENNPYLQWPINPYSPWGMLLEPERDLGSARPFRPEMLLSLLVLLLLVLAALFLFRGRLIPDQDVKDRRHYFYMKPIYIGGYSAAALILFQGRFFNLYIAKCTYQLYNLA